MRKRFLAVVVALCLGFQLWLPAVTAAGITDTTEHWAQVHIEKWISDGLITGYPDGSFKPDNSITRAELVTLVNRAFDIPDNNSTSSFSDVKPSDWFYGDVMSGQAAGYISGYPDGTFRPNNPITRQEAAALITNLLDLDPGDANAINAFADKQSIDDWAKPGISGVVSQGIMNGFPDKTFGPRKNITRAETVVTLDKALAYEPEAISGITGIVKLGNQPVKGATVRVFVKGSHESLKNAVTGQDGAFTFTVADGQYELTAVLDKNVGYAGPVTVTSGNTYSTQEVTLTTGARVTGKLVDKSGKALANTPVYFTTNPSFSGKTDNNGEFSVVLPTRGHDGQLLSYTGFIFHNGKREDFVTGQQFSGDTDLGQLNTNVPGQTTGGGGGGSNPPADDTTAPVWAPGYPNTSGITQNGFNLLLKASENGTAYYVVLADNSPAPTAAQVKSGTDSNGNPAVKSNSTALQADTEKSVNIGGLDAATSYDIYVVAEDAVPNLQTNAVKVEVTTEAVPDPGDTTAPEISSVSVNGNSLVVVFNENLDAASTPQKTDFTVKVNGAEATLSGVAISGTKVTLTLAEAVKAEDVVTLSYTTGANPLRDEAGNNAQSFADQAVTNNTGMLSAPENDLTVATNLFDSTSFLYTGENAVQTGMAEGTIEEQRAAVIRGKVLTREGTPLAGVKITVVGHPEFGSTLSREDGQFDMAVNGGGLLTVRYEKDTFITAQRQVTVPWQDYTLLPDVVLIPYDNHSTTVNLSPGSEMQVARGSIVTEGDVTRQATLILPGGVLAEMEMADGTTRPISDLTIRATEFTVGDRGPQAMPAVLPPNVGYTYCVEYSVDEAVAVGAKSVKFTRPVFHYLENFIDAPVGGIVPMGYYDYDQAAWVPSENGRVIKIMAIVDGKALLDVEGKGWVADDADLEALGITEDELQKLATLYSEGQELWRVPITHFSAWDCNWPYGPPIGADIPNLPAPTVNNIENPCTGAGSIIEYQNQVLGETSKVWGTSFTLNYRSSRVDGYRNSRTLNIPISGSEALHPDLKRIDLKITIAGQSFTKSFPPESNQSYVFTWDGKDAYGRRVQGGAPVRVRVEYVYPAIYLNPAPQTISFGQYGERPEPNEGWVSNRANLEGSAWQEWETKLVFWNDSPSAIGGWSLDIHHAYDPLNQVLNLGNGEQIRGHSNLIIKTVVGTGEGGYNDDNIAASQAQLNQPKGAVVGPDGSLYIADQYNYRIRKVSPDGRISTVAGTGTVGNYNDNVPAFWARIDPPVSIALGPDGSIYFSEYANHCIRRVTPSGYITTVAGNGTQEYGGDGHPATEAELNTPYGIAVAPDGTLYIADSENHRIRQVTPNGIITTIAGTGDIGHSGDGGPATEAMLDHPNAVALAPDGSLYITSGNSIRRIGTDGIITTVAGGAIEGYSGDGGPATRARLYWPNGITIGSDGSLYISDRMNHCIRLITPDGIISTLAGNGSEGYSGEEGPPAQAQLDFPSGVAIGPNGIVYVVDTGNNCIRQVSQPFVQSTANASWMIPSADGMELYVMDEKGRHLRTVNAFTGSDIYRFSYDEQGRLIAVEDDFGNVTRIERNGQGDPTAIVAPGGQTTYLETNENGYLSSIKCPLEKETKLEYTVDGLLTKLTDHKENIYSFTYDEKGRLIKDEDPAGGYTELLGSQLNGKSGYRVNVKNAEGLLSTYQVEKLPGNGTRRTDTDSMGGVTITEILADGTSKVTYPDGTKITLAKGKDPRLAIGMMAPITSEFTVTTPGGKTSTVTRDRAVETEDIFDPFAVTRLTDTVTSNGETYTTVYTIDRESSSPTIAVTSTTPEGRQSIITLDHYGRLIEEKNGDLEPVKYTYDNSGRLATVEQGNQTLTYSYDVMNRIAALVDAGGAKFQYEYNGADLLTKLTMPGGQAYTFDYDANGNVTAITMPSGDKHQLDYTVVDLPQGYTPPGNESYGKSYKLDRTVDRLILPSGRSVVYQYDGIGRVTGLQYNDITSTFGFGDNTDRVTSIQRFPDDISYGFAYDGTLPTEMTVSGSVNGSYTYRYNNNFNLAGFTFAGESEVGLMYDKDGLAVQYGSFGITRGHSFGLPTAISNGVMTVTYGYDSYGRMTGRVHTVNGNEVYRLGLHYDNTGLISQRNETVAALGNTQSTYEYDANKQLTGVTGSKTETYTYDANGNRLSGNALYDAQDRLTSLGGVTYQFNEDGFLTQRGSDAFEYSAQGELLKATLETGTEISYLYDGVGRRVARSVKTGEEPPALTEQYLYGNPGNPFEVTSVRDSNGVVSHYYYDQVNCLFAIKQGSEWYYVATDQQGTPRVVSDATGQVVKVMEYDSFGKLISDSKPDFRLPIGFAGGISDPDTGLVHFGMRDYDPAAGRWTARDPILFNGQQGNLYVYVSNNPVNLRDPSGLFCIGGSYFAGVGIGGQLCITGEGVSVCGEVGFGVGGGVEIAPFGGLAKTGTTIAAQAEATYFGVGPSVGLSLDSCGSLLFTGAVKAGPFSKAVNYDFLEGKWNTGDLAVGGGKGDMNKSWADSFKPKLGASAKISGQGCLRF